jgi:phage FluMu protein Com
MQTPLPARDAARQSLPSRASTPPANARPSEWRCTRCDKLLGVCRNGRMHLRFARGHEYFVGFPIEATCRGCGTLNQTNAPTR